MKNTAFLDHDGVINSKAPEGQYVTRWADMGFLPGLREAIRLLNDAGFLVIVVSNQRCVAKGLITTEDLESMHVRMCREFHAAGATLTRFTTVHMTTSRHATAASLSRGCCWMPRARTMFSWPRRG